MQEKIDFIIEQWGDAGKNVVAACERVSPFNGKFEDFLDHCTACGGNWGAMFLTGIRELFPEVWDAIPEDMGHESFFCLCYTLQLCGIHCS